MLEYSGSAGSGQAHGKAPAALVRAVQVRTAHEGPAEFTRPGRLVPYFYTGKKEKMMNEISSDAPTHDSMCYEVRDPQGGLVGEAASVSSAQHLHEVAKEVYGEGSTVAPK